MSDIYKFAGILIKDRKLLVEKSYSKPFYVAPGGKPDEGENGTQALIRELKEELNIDTDEKDFEEFGKFSAPAAGNEEFVVHMKIWIVKKWQGEPEPTSEVEKIAWVTSDNPDSLPIGSIFEHEVIPRLKNMNLID